MVGVSILKKAVLHAYSGLRLRWTWALWLVLTAMAFAFMVRWIQKGEDRRALLPGRTTDGHHQIERRCDVCHEPAGAVRKDACVKCHGDELKRVKDSHPERKFTDPRNANLLVGLDARECAACHVEHKPQWTGKMGVTLPMDYCAHCHQDIAKDRPSHKGMGFETCATAGCHNFHDNSALYEDFLAAHLESPPLLPAPVVAAGPPLRLKMNGDTAAPAPALLPEQADAPPEHLGDQAVLHAWKSDAHSAAGVNCSDCHGRPWTAKPAWKICGECHHAETRTFLEGRHGMRLAQDLGPMRPESARIPMKAGAAHKELTCVACHGAHDFDTRRAATESCLQCHDDPHSRAYIGSPHHLAFQRELAGMGAPGSGVSCATCHMPRQADGRDPARWTHADHNQNATLRPNEKMLRPVCLNCHGLGFSLDALSDSVLVRNNFAAAPTTRIPSLDMVRNRIRDYAKSRGKPAENAP